jgi:hypothetical protein
VVEIVSWVVERCSPNQALQRTRNKPCAAEPLAISGPLAEARSGCARPLIAGC